MNLSTYEFKTDFIGRPYREGYAVGFAEGRAEALAKRLAENHSVIVLEVLDTRGLAVSEDIRTRITACTDPDQLDTWLRRAVTVAHAEELFG